MKIGHVYNLYTGGKSHRRDKVFIQNFINTSVKERRYVRYIGIVEVQE
jgi:hypothetical protein